MDRSQWPKWLDAYSGQTTSQLLGLEHEFRVASLILGFEQAIDQKAAREGNDHLTKEEFMVLAIEALEREVNNGGYRQFFINSSRQYTPTIVDSLLRIGCPRTAEITRMAIDALKLSNLTGDQIDVAMAKADRERDKTLNACDKLYFSEAEPVADRLFAFIKAHQNLFPL